MAAHLRFALLTGVLAGFVAPSSSLAADRLPNPVEVQFPTPPEAAKTPPKKRKRVRKAVVKETAPEPTPESSPVTDPITDPMQLPDVIEKGPAVANLPGDETPAPPPAPPPASKSDFLPSKCPDVK